MIKIYNMDVMKALKKMPDKSVDMQITSPPYWALRNYGVDGQLGLESTFDEYIKKLCDIFDEVKRVLKDDGTCWVNLGDNYFTKRTSDREVNKINPNQKSGHPIKIIEQGIKSKCLVGVPMRFAIEMMNRGWILRNTIIWYKPGCMPSSAKDRFTVDFEYIFFFTKKKKYYFEQQLEPIKNETLERNKSGEKGDKITAIGRDRKAGEFATKQGDELMRNKRCVWEINTHSFSAKKYGFKDVDHFATFPKKLVETPIKTTRKNAIIMDIFAGKGTTLEVARDLGRDSIGIEINPDYVEIAKAVLTHDKKGNRNLHPEPEVIK